MSGRRGTQSLHEYDDDDDETSKLLRTIPPGISTRAHSISGTQSAILEPKDVYKSRWRSIRVMYLTMFLSSVSFSICMSSLYPYLKILDKTATADFLGWVVAAYSVGQLVASPFFGFWSNKRSKTREPIIASLVINILANVLYVYLESIKTAPKIFLLLARILIGFGAGNVAVVRSYISGATTLAERTVTMTNMSAFQAVGFIIGPLIQTAMVPIGYPGPIFKPGLHFDMYTATGFFSAVVGIVNVVLLIVVFKEHTVPDDQFSAVNIQSGPEDTIISNEDEVETDYLAVIASIVLFFSVLFVFAVFETIATPFSMHMFAWTKSEATLYIGVMLGCAGIVSIVVFLFIKVLSKRFNERYLLLFGFIMCTIGFVVYLPWGHQYPDIQYAEQTRSANTSGNGSIQHITGFKSDLFNQSEAIDHIKPLMIDTGQQMPVVPNVHIPMPSTNYSHNSSKEAVGCPYYYHWCFTTPAVYLWQFLLGTFCVSVGYPTCNVMSYAIYSKILGSKPQGIWMGWLTAAGSLARTLGPVFVTQVYDASGPRVTFTAIIAIIVITILGFLIVFRRLVPMKLQRTVVVDG